MLLTLARWSVLALCLRAVLPCCATAFPTDLQQAVSRAMSGLRGTAVVLDVHSGHVLASYRLDVAAKRLAYPGSSVKPFTLKVLLEAGKLDSHTAIMCKRPLAIAGHRLDCSHPLTNVPLEPAAALAYSCNAYFSTAALRLSAAQLHDALIADGFDSVTGLAPSEAAGEVALASSPDQEQLQAIGEWGVKVTPLEVARAYRQLALLVASHEAKLDPLFAGLQQSVTYGMARLAQPDEPMRVAGKTGTAPADEGAWTHAWFAGYAPADNPDMVVVVFLERGHGGTDAASVARKIFEVYAKHQTEHLRVANSGARP